MLDQLEALRALRDAGTTGQAAVRLRLTQSAISKRIAALEATVGVPLVERVGRRVVLTAEGERLLADAEPLVAQLRAVVAEHGAPSDVLRVAASESLLSAFLPELLAKAAAQVPGLRLDLHAHRGPSLLERVRSGEYALGICAGAGAEGDLHVEPLGEEPMVIVPRGDEPFTLDGPVSVWTIEERSLTWQAVAPRIRRKTRDWGFSLVVEQRLESFTALVQIARAGFARALVPEGVARALGAPHVRVPGLSRPLVTVGRRSTYDRRSVRGFLSSLRDGWPR